MREEREVRTAALELPPHDLTLGPQLEIAVAETSHLGDVALARRRSAPATSRAARRETPANAHSPTRSPAGPRRRRAAPARAATAARPARRAAAADLVKALTPAPRADVEAQPEVDLAGRRPTRGRPSPRRSGTRGAPRARASPPRRPRRSCVEPRTRSVSPSSDKLLDVERDVVRHGRGRARAGSRSRAAPTAPGPPKSRRCFSSAAISLCSCAFSLTMVRTPGSAPVKIERMSRADRVAPRRELARVEHEARRPSGRPPTTARTPARASPRHSASRSR